MDKRRGRPFPDAVMLKPLAFNLEEALQVENLYRPNLLAINHHNIKPGEVTLKSRDEAVQILRFLRVWLDIPHSVFFSAVSYLDMFLARMKVQEKFLRCVTLSCLYLAAENESCKVDVNYVVKISQSKCTSGDVLRMANIVKEKIKTPGGEKPTTPADFLKIYIDIFKCVTSHWEHIMTRDLIQIRERMLILLEVLLADSNTAYFRPAALALIVFQGEVEKIMAQGLPNKSVYYLGEVLQFLTIIREIQLKCKIKNAELKNCYLQVSKVLNHYDSHKKNNCREQLSWNFSLSTLMKKRSCGYHPLFQTIKEWIFNTKDLNERPLTIVSTCFSLYVAFDRLVTQNQFVFCVGYARPKICTLCMSVELLS